MVCTPTLPGDEVEHLKGLLAASQERTAEVQRELAAYKGRECDLSSRVAAAQAEAGLEMGYAESRHLRRA